jgi:hypothetical protein
VIKRSCKNIKPHNINIINSNNETEFNSLSNCTKIEITQDNDIEITIASL